ncbi:MAG: hypothetical protein EOO38_24305 [Cytophagaceae bacterium]|nr:MAG: hypothetical protein EOO38_24305 [Cytophagaceae bacterium]
MNAIRIRTQVNQNYELILQHLPLSKGQRVEIIILEDDSENAAVTEDRFPLRNRPIRYDDPFGSAAGSTDWEANV